MAKKKNSPKKHNFKHLAERETAAPAVSASANEAAAPAKSPAALRTAPAGTTPRDFSYVAGDMKRIGLFAAGLIALELALYYLMSHTALGQTIYNLVKV